MNIVTSVRDMQAMALDFKRQGQQVGFVPTMGYFHEGHLSLMDQSIAYNDMTVVSLFVNPIQFDEGEDYDIYPRDMERDKQLARDRGVDILFCPDPPEMYPGHFSSQVIVKGLTDKLCGASRPGHFEGVTTVVSKLFHIVMPDKAYFGKKDYQQLLVIQQMVQDLNFPVEVVGCPIAREADGLAISSRNVNLNREERHRATVLYRALQVAQEEIERGERSKEAIVSLITQIINQEKLTEIDYVEVVSASDLGDLEVLEGPVLIALAVRVGKTRLIDNLVVHVSL